MEKTNTMTTIYERLKALQINLPELPPPLVDAYVPSFVPFVRAGNLIYLSGRLAKKDGKPFSGKLGQQITTAEGSRPRVTSPSKSSPRCRRPLAT
jgi:hypothetical protein